MIMDEKRRNGSVRKIKINLRILLTR